jgi:sulfur carrier protein
MNPNQISVNGQQRAHTTGTTVGDVVLSLTANTDGCAVAVNDMVIPRSHWAERAVEPGDRIEVLTAVQGG